MLRPFALLFACAACAFPLLAQASSPARAPLPLSHPLQDKNFYLFSLVEQSTAVEQALRENPDLDKIAAERAASAHTSTEGGPNAAYLSIAPLLWTPEQIDRAATALAGLYHDNPAVRNLVDGPLSTSGVGPANTTGAELLTFVWRREAEGMNKVLSTYGLGIAPVYANIDSSIYSTGDPEYREFLQDLVRVVGASDAHALFAKPALDASILLLEANERDEAARFEPMEADANAAALRHLPSIDWKSYRYSVIMIPGIGPDLPGVSLSPMGLLHARAAAESYRKGLAPFILLSGGFVHPSRTPYSEAVEMKRVLIQQFGIPAEAILIDPHARHTTTNLRNAARILYRDGLPLDRPALIVGDPFQSNYILSKGFALRCDRELGYRPFLSLNPIAADTIVWTPNFVASLEQDPRDPLDP